MAAKFLLQPVHPFRLDLTAWALQRRPGNLIDRWDGAVYRRVLTVDGRTFEIAVSQAGEAAGTLGVTIAGNSLRRGTKQRTRELVVSALGIRVDLSGFYRMTENHSRLKFLAQSFRGLKPPRFFSAYEGLINGIACQQFSLSLGIQLLGRLARSFGPSVDNGGSVNYGFPLPADLANAKVAEIKKLGFSLQKARAMVEISRAIVEGRLDLDALAAEGDDEALRRLEELRGVGRWTAEYTLLRGMGRWHIFPVDDQGARNGLARWLHLRKRLDAARTQRILEQWHPYGGLIYFHMLMNGLNEAGYLGGTLLEEG
ncbi:MAG TPA: DNA-3-methyladenine glycosylase 2 family protein [Terriglobia bacterium]|nr:DNA-3-methyladenine glycosylase 2 family protein [Terriglobia bacterium]